MANRFTEGLKQLTNGLYRIREDVLVSDKTIVEKLKPSKITESVAGNELPIFGKYTIKVWDLTNLNKNGRNYGDVVDLALKVPTTDGLANHPEDDEWDVTKTFAVETNPRVLNDWLCCDITLVGELGRLAESILRAGGQLRFSSSAQGDVGPTGRVLREGFVLERFADWVANPSSGVWNYLEDIQESKNNRHKREEIENLTMYKEQEYNSMDNKLQESVERILAQNINGMFKAVEAENSIIEKKTLLEQIIQESANLSDKTLYEKATKKKAEVEKELEEKAKVAEEVDEVKEELKTKEEEILDKEDKIEDLKEKVIILERKYKTLVEMYENKQYISSSKEKQITESLSKEVQTLKQSNKALKEKLESDRKAFESIRGKLTEKVQYFEALSNTKVDSEKVIKLSEEIKTLKEMVNMNQSKLREAHQVINDQKLKLIEARKQALKNRITEKEDTPLRRKFQQAPLREDARQTTRKPLKEKFESGYDDDSLVSRMDMKDKERLIESAQDDYVGFSVKQSDISPVSSQGSSMTSLVPSQRVSSASSTLTESWDGYDEGDEEAILKASQRIDGNTVLERIKENGR